MQTKEIAWRDSESMRFVAFFLMELKSFIWSLPYWNSTKHVKAHRCCNR